jgi:hypothetical protein
VYSLVNPAARKDGDIDHGREVLKGEGVSYCIGTPKCYGRDAGYGGPAAVPSRVCILTAFGLSVFKALRARTTNQLQPQPVASAGLLPSRNCRKRKRWG